MTTGDSLLVLTYHALDTRQCVISVAPEQFRRQMETLASNGLSGISLADAFEHRERTGRFPGDSVALTFDDGYLSVLEQALPAMRELGFRGTAFIISGLVGLNAAQARDRNRHIDRDLMDWSQLAELAGGGFELASHSVDHPDLTRLDAGGLERELAASRDHLQQALQMPVQSFAYPYGHTNRTVSVAAAAHYRHACTTRLGRHGRDADPLQIRRVDAYFLRNPAMFERLITGRLDAYLGLRQKLRDMKRLLH